MITVDQDLGTSEAASERAAWLGWRRGDDLPAGRYAITATDVAQAMTGYYGSAYTVCDEKLSGSSDDDPTAAMLRGLAAEGPISRAVEALTGLRVINAQLRAEHPDRPEFRCTLDGELSLDEIGAPPLAVGEWKTVGQRVRPPFEYYVCQTNWQMLVRGLPVALLARGDYEDQDDGSEVLVGLRLQRIEADPVLQAELVACADRMLGYLAAGKLPPPNGSAFTSELIKAKYSHVDPFLSEQPVELYDLEELFEERLDVVAELDRLGARKAEIENVVKDRLGHNKFGEADGWRITWPARRSLDLDALRAHPDYRDLVDKHSTVSVDVDLGALASDLGKKVADSFRTVPTGRSGLRITKQKDNS